LPEYYEFFALHNTIRFLDYAFDEQLILDNFLRPYRKAGAELGRFTILEIGAGIPHGFIHEQLAAPGFCESLTVVDLDTPYTSFVEWLCTREQIPFTLV
jgi:hypothetical protein